MYMKNLPTIPIIFKFSLIELHVQVWRLEVKSHHLAAGVPKYLRHIVTGIHPTSFWVDTTHLPLIIARLVKDIYFSDWLHLY